MNTKVIYPADWKADDARNLKALSNCKLQKKGKKVIDQWLVSACTWSPFEKCVIRITVERSGKQEIQGAPFKCRNLFDAHSACPIYIKVLFVKYGIREFEITIHDRELLLEANDTVRATIQLTQ